MTDEYLLLGALEKREGQRIVSWGTGWAVLGQVGNSLHGARPGMTLEIAGIRQSSNINHSSVKKSGTREVVLRGL